MKKRTIIITICAIVIPLLIETFIFNGVFWRTINNNKPQQAELSFSSSISEANGVYTVLSKDDAYIDIEANVPITSLHLPLGTISTATTNGWMGLDAGTVLISRVDFLDNNTHKTADFCSKIPSTLYVTAPLSTQSNHVRISFTHNRDVNVSFTLNEPFLINEKIPFFFSPLRLFIMYLLIGIVAILRPKSFLWRISFAHSIQARRICACTLMVAFSVVLVTVLSSKQSINDTYVIEPETLPNGAFQVDDNQYDYLAQAFASGQVKLNLPVPKWLSNMQNPYDAQLRGELGKQSGKYSYWDYAFYDGNYYCYFGALPAAILYLPYYLVTGGVFLSNSDALLVLSILFSIASVLLVYGLFKRYFPNKSLGTFNIIAITFASGAGMIYLCFYPGFYTVAIASSLVCALFGIACWLLCVQNKSVQNNLQETHSKINKPLLIIGSLCITATLFCRPNFFLAVFLAFPLFWKQIKVERLFFSKKGLSNTLCVLIPVLLVLALAMTYNAARFGSPFDFGFTHNLTGYDASEQTPFNLAKTLLAIALFLVVPFIVMKEFPFLRAVATGNNPLAATLIPKTGLIVEPFFCGAFILTPPFFGIFLLFAKSVRAQLHKRRALGLAFIALILGCIALLLDTQVAVTPRYLSDFSWLFLIAALLAILGFSVKSRSEKAQLRYKRIFVFLIITGVIITAWTLSGTHYYESWIDTNPGLHFTFDSWYLTLQNLI